MNGFNIFILMVLCHVLDDFFFQTSLANLKQKKWWIDVCKEKNIDFSKYKYDYLMSLAMHSMSWSAMILLPIFIFMPTAKYVFIVWLVNALIHFFVDDLKANRYKISLVTDQTAHLIQMIITLLFFSYGY